MLPLNQKLDGAFNPPSLQILKIDREGMIDDVKMNMMSLVMTSYEVIYVKILVTPVAGDARKKFHFSCLDMYSYNNYIEVR